MSEAMTNKELGRTVEEDQPPRDYVETSSKSPGQRMGALRRRVLMTSLCLALFLSALDVTIIATALPTIASALNANATEYAWVGSAYTLSSTSSTVIWAKFSDIFGRKIILMTANGIFMAGSVVAALSQSIAMLIGARIIQGLGASGILVMVTIIIGDLFALSERAKYYALSTLVWAVAGSVGPVLGGIFTQTIGWRWCFWINLPFEALSLCVLFVVLRIESVPVSLMEGLRLLDWIGSALIVGSTICFLYGLQSGSNGSHDWSSATVICLIVFGVLMMALFIVYEAKVAKNPIVPVHIFSKTTNIAAFGTTCLHSFIFISYDFFLPLYFQVVLGFKPIISGVTLFGLVTPLSVATASTGLLVNKTGDFCAPIWIGAVIMTLGTGLFIDLDSTTNWPKIIIFEIITGIGAGPLFQSPMIALQSHIPPESVPAAMGALTFMRNLMSACSIVIGTVVLQGQLDGGTLTPAGSVATSGHDTDEDIINKEAYKSALDIMWTFYTATGGVMMLVSLLIKKKDIRDNKSAVQPSLDPKEG